MLKPPFVLIVEDNPFDVKLKKVMLHKHQFPFETVFVRDGAEALDFLFCRESFRERPHINPSLILLDFRLPKLDGLQVLEQMRAHPQLRSIPVVMVVSTREDHVEIARKGLHVFGFLLKPIEYRKLEDIIDGLEDFRHWKQLNAGVPDQAPVGLTRPAS